MAKYFKALAGAALLLACVAASAQLPKGNGGAEFDGMSKTRPDAPQILRNYIENAQALLNAEKELLAAVGLSEQAAKAGAEAQGLGATASRSQIEAALKVQADSAAALRQALEGKPELSEANRPQFINGLSELSRGTVNSAEMARSLVEVRKFLKADSSAGVAAQYLSRALPGAVKELGQTLQATAAYAEAKRITLPQTTSEALSRF